MRSTQCHIPHLRSEEENLTVQILRLATRYGRYGYHRITALLKQQDWKVNHKRIERIWRREGLKLPQSSLLNPGVLGEWIYRIIQWKTKR